MTRARRITWELQKKDKDLFCLENEAMGYLQILRKSYQTRTVFINEHDVVTYPVMVPQLVLALTHDWTVKGRPVDWGLEPITRKLISIDCWNNVEADALKLEEVSEKVDQRKLRNFNNETEAFLKDFRPQFQKTFNDVNTSNLERIDRRRNGNC